MGRDPDKRSLVRDERRSVTEGSFFYSRFFISSIEINPSDDKEYLHLCYDIQGD